MSASLQQSGESAVRFTSGPWRVITSDGDGRNRGFTDTRIEGPNRANVVGYDFKTITSGGETESYARCAIKPEDAALIAAAPDMYAELDNLCLQVGGMLYKLDELGYKETYETLLASVRSSRAALAKAGGN